MTESTEQKLTILTIDDNLYTLDILQHALEKANFNTVAASSGEKGLSLIMEYGLPHLAVVDLNMPPGMSGFQFCRKVHQFSDLPVIMLTAIDEESTIVTGLESHAEDYVTKPFNPGELVARIRRVLRRMGEFTFEYAPVTKVDDSLSVNFAKRRAIICGESVSLTPTETKLLYILMRSTGQTVTTEFIIRRIWPHEPVFEDRLHVHMHRLRRKLEARDELQYILSERGQGYAFHVGLGDPEAS